MTGRTRPRRLEPWGAALSGIAMLATATAATVPEPARAASDDPPFSVLAHDLPGRVLQVWPLAVSSCDGSEGDLLVLTAEGGPPDQTRRIHWMPCGSALRPGAAAIIERPVPPEVVLVDVARTPGRAGPQLVSADAHGLAIEALDAGPTPTTPDRLEWAVPGGLPLPPRPRGLSRVEIVADWHGTGRPVALVPALDGGRLVDLETGAVRALPMPVYADYRGWEPFLPAPVRKWTLADVTWPGLSRADENGDGRDDLFVLSRWAIWVYRTGPDGLPEDPTRRLEWRPFDAEAERRHEATSHEIFVRDLDGDRRADLLLTTVSGGLMQGRSRAVVHRGGPEGLRLDAAPDALREVTDGYASFHLLDVDGDGRAEIVETTLEFGPIQLARILLTRRAEMVLRILAFDPAAPGGTRELFEDDLSFRLDFASGRITGLVPGSGDWNGDGHQDLFEADGDDGIRIRLGAARGKTPLFGASVAHQPVPIASGESRTADLDGDGLDDLVAFDPTDPDAALVVLHNRGRLPGTRPELHPARPGGDRSGAPSPGDR